MTETASFGATLRTAREAKGLSRHEFAERVGVSRATVTRWEKNEDHPRGERLRVIANVLGLSLEALTAQPEETSAPEPVPASERKSDARMERLLAHVRAELLKAWPEARGEIIDLLKTQITLLVRGREREDSPAAAAPKTAPTRRPRRPAVARAAKEPPQQRKKAGG